jgi:uncharacterized protein YkwD
MLLAVASLAACHENARTRVSDDAIPDSGYCRAARSWDPDWGDWEREVVGLVNEQRARGGACGGIRYYPRPPLVVDDALRCAARKHALDMVDRDYVDHRSPEGSLPPDRMRYAGYRPRRAAENIAVVAHPILALPAAAEAVLDVTHIRHLPSPARAVELWMDSPQHCETIMNDEFEHTGAGYVLAANGAPIFIQTFARPFD